MRKKMVGFAALALSLSASAVAQGSSAYDATITRTTYGIAHIEASTWEGVGYGVAYAYAQDNVCMLAEELTTVAGERSLHFGPDGKTMLGPRETDNLSSDVFYRSQIDLASLKAGASDQHAESHRLLTGYAAGYNRYLRDVGPDGLPEECRGKSYVQPITYDDMLRLTEKSMLRASSLFLGAGIAQAAPPGNETASADITLPAQDELGLGSNGWAFGGEATTDSRGLLVGNPHFPWEGPARFWQMHVRGPDGYDVMGVGLAGTAIPTLGFNKDVAWTHTVTAARHFTLHALTLAPDDPTSYMLDGEPVEMEAREISVPMPYGADPVVRTIYSSRFGAIVTAPASGLNWTQNMAFAIADANSGNQRAFDAWLAIGKAQNVAEVEAAVSDTMGIPWVNTIAADREGNALHADITVVPNVSADLVEECATPYSGLVANLVTLLDGSRTQCDWRTLETDAPYPGLLPAEDQASRTRRDYVTNSNDSYWISNPRDPYTRLSPILGAHSKALSLRTRSNFTETEAALAKGKMDHDRAKSLVFANKSLAADLAVDPLLRLCESRAVETELVASCDALTGWDRRVDVSSKGAALFLRFWEKVRERRDLWTVPFDAENPIATPSGLKTDAGAGDAMLEALAEAADDLTNAGIALDASWGDVQVRLDGEERIAIHGGPGTAGILNMQRSRPIKGGITPVHGSSYIQIVGFDEDGPVADAILSYSQSTDPSSPHYADQTRAYSRKEWHRLPFSDAEIAEAQIGEPLRISE